MTYDLLYLQKQKKMEPQEFRASQSYREWWEANRERVLREDQIRHDMGMKAAIAKDPDAFLETNASEE
jgi:hypothetical protein